MDLRGSVRVSMLLSHFFVTLQNFIMKIAPDHSVTLSSLVTPEGLDTARADKFFSVISLKKGCLCGKLV